MRWTSERRKPARVGDRREVEFYAWVPTRVEVYDEGDPVGSETRWLERVTAKQRFYEYNFMEYWYDTFVMFCTLGLKRGEWRNTEFVDAALDRLREL